MQGDLLQAALTDFDIAAIDESAPDGWRVFFRTSADRDRAQRTIAREFPGLRSPPRRARRGLGRAVAGEPEGRPRRQHDRGAAVGRADRGGDPAVDGLRHGPPRDHAAVPRGAAGARVKERTVIDVGTGSGVLAIAASLLGAVDVRGIDDDEDAIQAAWDNSRSTRRPSSRCSSATCGPRRSIPADIVFANLTGGLLMASAGAIGALAGTHGKLILSGFQADEEKAVVAAFAGFAVERRDEEDEWVCVTLRREPGGG